MSSHMLRIKSEIAKGKNAKYRSQ